MDFKSHEEYVLPPGKGVDASRKERESSKPAGLGEPRSYKRPGQQPVLDGGETPTEGIMAPREIRDESDLPQLDSSKSPESSASVHDAIDEAVRKIDAVNDDLNRERELEGHEEIEAETMSISDDDWMGMAGGADTSSVPTDRVPDVTGCSTTTLEDEEVDAGDDAESDSAGLDASDDDDLDVLEEVSKQISQLASKESSQDARRQLDEEEPDGSPRSDEESRVRVGAQAPVPPLEDDEDDETAMAVEHPPADREEDAATSEVRKGPRAAAENPPASRARQQTAPAATRSRRPAPRDSADISDFIIAYDGHFLGSYRSFRRITHRTAFIRAAQRLKESVDDFDIEKLELFKPTPVNVEPQDVVSQLDDEEFSWFGA